MDNTITQPFLNTLDGIAPRQETSHDVSRVIAQVQEEEYQKKLDALEVGQANFAKQKKRTNEQFEAERKVLDERETRAKLDQKRADEQSKQALQSKAENDAKEKALDRLEEQIRQNFDESESKLKSANDAYLVAESLLKKAEIISNQVAQLQTNSFEEINKKLASLTQIVADNGIKNDLILEELSKPKSPQVKKKTKTHSNLDQLNLFVSKSETTQPIKVLSSDYIFRLNDGDSYDQCLNIQEFIDTYSHLSRINENLDEFFSTFEFSFHEEGEPLLEVSFNDLHEDTQNDLLNIFSENT